MEVEIDAIGLLCPLPVLRLRKRMAGLTEGAVVTLLASDPASRIDVPHFCATEGHDLLAESTTTPAGGGPLQFLYRIRRGPDRPSP